ncbi:MAG: hypothetical protein ACOCP8_00390 [archaeon]
MKIDDIKLENWFTIVQEPEYSNKKLKEFEKKYNLNSIYVYEEHKKGNIVLDDEYEVSSWVHNFIINAQNQGIYSRYRIKGGK